MNKKKVYRVEHKSIKPIPTLTYNVGPFMYLNSIFKDDRNKHLRTENLIKLRNIMGYRDDSFRRLYHNYMDYDKFRSMKAFPACFSLERPGPNEDPLLRTPFSKIKKEDKLSGLFPFCFESIESLKKWFCDPIENKYLQKNGFVISEYKVPTKKLITGYHQSIFEDSTQTQKIGMISIF